MVAAWIGTVLLGFGVFIVWKEHRLRERLLAPPSPDAEKAPGPASTAAGTPTGSETSPLEEAEATTAAPTMLPSTNHALPLLCAVALLAIAAGLVIAEEALGADSGLALEGTPEPVAPQSEEATEDGVEGQEDPATRGRERSLPTEIRYVDVGQGDAVVMHVGPDYVVSDAGEYNVEAVDDALRAMDAQEIDVAILSHPHQDHVKNFTDLLDTYGWKIGTAVLSASEHWERTATNRNLMSALRRHQVPLTYVSAGDSFDWGGAEWEILNPPAGRYLASGQEANASIVYRLLVGRTQFFFTGDVGRSVERRLASTWTNNGLGRVNVFLATHHGSGSGSNTELLEAIRPRWAVLSTGPNRFQHPRPQTITRLRAAGASIWCTAVNGTVIARISASGRFSWRTSEQPTPWWSARTKRQSGRCVGR